MPTNIVGMTFKPLPILSTIIMMATSTLSLADVIDNGLRNRLEFFGVTKYELLPVDNSPEAVAKVELGRRLFIDPNLSGNKNISCMNCHHPMLGTSDGLPLSQTEDGKGVLRRNSPGLFNIGDKFNVNMFWDARVNYHPGNKIFTTPEPSLNGANPKSVEITSVMKSALAAQAIFPLVNVEEMKGRPGDNEIANAKDNLEAWDLIIKRITTKSDPGKYVTLFNRAYPETVSEKKINIGHAGEAMAAFMAVQFQSNTSPFHRYVAGDNSAMSAQEKRGLSVFINRGNCIACHQGSLLGNNTFLTSVGVPALGARPFVADRGRGEINKEFHRDYFFKTPSLINVALTAPYMHNGAFKTLREVINHYNNVEKSLNDFDITPRKSEFKVDVEVLNSQAQKDDIFYSIQANFLKRGLGLTPAELDDLEAFLTGALTDPKWKPMPKPQGRNLK